MPTPDQPKPKQRRENVEARLAELAARLDRLEKPQAPLAFDDDALERCSAELNAARDEIERANRQRLELFGLLNREIRTPLAGLLGVASLLRRLDLDEAAADYAATIEACGTEVMGLLNEALRLADLSPQELDAAVALRQKNARSLDMRATAPEPPRDMQTTLELSARHPRPRVLVVEDNLINQKVARKHLERAGVDVEIANDGHEALAALERERYALVLMDCEMPGCDGYTATRELRRRERKSGAKRQPVIALTASWLPEERLRCFECGMDDFLAKPASTEALLGKLRDWLPKLTAAA